MFKQSNKGFTLVELMVVVVIIGIIASIGVPKLNAFIKTAETSEADTIAARIISSFEIRDNWSEGNFIAEPRDTNGEITGPDTISHLINLEIPFGHEWSYEVFIVTTDPSPGPGIVEAACIRAWKDTDGDSTNATFTRGAGTEWLQRSVGAPDPTLVAWDNNTYKQPYVNGEVADATSGDCTAP